MTHRSRPQGYICSSPGQRLMTQTEAYHRYRLKKEDLEVSQQAFLD